MNIVTVKAYAAEHGLTYNQAYYQLHLPALREQKHKYYQQNKDRIIEKSAHWRSRQPAHANALSRQRKQRAKLALIALLGGVCCRCGFSDERALQVDHRNGRKGLNGPRGGDHLYHRILNGTVEAALFQLLCANCNSIKRFERGEGCIARTRSLLEVNHG